MTEACVAEDLNPQEAVWSNEMASVGRAPGSRSGLATLTRRMTRGDETAFQEFFETYFPRLLRYLLVVTRGREDEAREALQLTLLRVVKYIRCFDSEPAFWSWLTVLARSALADERRKRQRYSGLLARFLRKLPIPLSPPDRDADIQLASLLRAELGVLPAKDRDLLSRKYEAEQSVREIAADLGLSEKAVESRLTRARKRLKDAVLARLKHNE